MANPSRFTSGVWAGNKGRLVKTEAPVKQVSIPIRFSDGTTTNTTDFTFPANSILWPQVFLLVRTAEVTGTTKTIDVGVSNLANDAVLQKIAVDSTGLLKGSVLKGGVTLGTALFVDGGVSGDVANVPEPSVAVGIGTVNWTPQSANFAELEADILLFYQDVRAQPDG